MGLIVLFYYLCLCYGYILYYSIQFYYLIVLWSGGLDGVYGCFSWLCSMNQDGIIIDYIVYIIDCSVGVGIGFSFMLLNYIW